MKTTPVGGSEKTNPNNPNFQAAIMTVLSLWSRIRVRDELRQSREGRLTAESRVLGVPGFRIKPALSKPNGPNADLWPETRSTNLETCPALGHELGANGATSNGSETGRMGPK